MDSWLRPWVVYPNDTLAIYKASVAKRPDTALDKKQAIPPGAHSKLHVSIRVPDASKFHNGLVMWILLAGLRYFVSLGSSANS